MDNNNKLSKILDIAVIFLILSPFLFFLLSFLFYWFNQGLYNSIIDLNKSPVLLILAVITCVVLVLWITIGKGSESKAWNWLPPFVFFQQLSVVGRKVLVFCLVIGTLIGVLGEFFEIIKPKF